MYYFNFNPIGRIATLAFIIGSLPQSAWLQETLNYRVEARYPHDPQAFTQGLYYDAVENILYESVGQYGLSEVRKVALSSGKILQRKPLPARLFGEGLTVWKEKIIVLTWREHIGLILDKDTLQQLGTFQYTTQGWGLTHNAQYLIMSNGSATLQFLDPDTFKVVYTQEVRERGQPVAYLNELEWIQGELYANIWRSPDIVVIDPATGQVKRRLSLKPLSLTHADRDVLNGIAYNPTEKQLFVTGKLWPILYALSYP